MKAKNKSLPYQKYEELVKKLIKSLERANLQIEELGHGSKNKVEGKSGYKHQIDISFLIQGEKWLVECKHWRSKVKFKDVLIFMAHIIDIRNKQPRVNVKGLMITTCGYQKGGSQKIAEAYGIDLGKVKNESEFGILINKTKFLGLQEKAKATGEKVFVKKS